MARCRCELRQFPALRFWVAIWLLFLLMRLSPLDIRNIPGIGIVMLIALVVALLAPIVATGLAGAALVRSPRAPLNVLTFGRARDASMCEIPIDQPYFRAFDRYGSSKPCSLPAMKGRPAVTLAELAAGPHATENKDERARRQDRLQWATATWDPLPFDADSARMYGRVFAAARAAGQSS